MEYVERKAFNYLAALWCFREPLKIMNAAGHAINANALAN